MTKAVLPHMRAQAGGRIINISSVLGFAPAPYMAAYAASKHAIEGYSESLDQEVREHGVRVLLVEPAYTNTGFEGNSVQADTPLPVYAQQRHIFDDVMAAAMKDGDDPAVVAKVIVAAATDPKPKLRYTAGPTAGRVSTLRRIVPARAFDKQIRKLNRLAGWPAGRLAGWPAGRLTGPELRANHDPVGQLADQHAPPPAAASEPAAPQRRSPAASASAATGSSWCRRARGPTATPRSSRPPGPRAPTSAPASGSCAPRPACRATASRTAQPPTHDTSDTYGRQAGLRAMGSRVPAKAIWRCRGSRLP
jgi:hypothetical protein